MQEAYLTLKFPQIYWNTACLCVNAGTLDEIEYEPEYDLETLSEDEEDLEEKRKKAQGVNYGKIAKAIGLTVQAGIKVAPPNINDAEKEFKPDDKNNQIIYSLKALSGVGDKELDQIFELRPFSSLSDYLEKTHLKKTATLNLIKAGAFDILEPNKTREEIMKEYIEVISEPKKKLNLQNLSGLIGANLLPTELDHYRKLYNFNKYIRQKEFKNIFPGYLIIDERACNYLSINYQDFFENCVKSKNNYLVIDEKIWKKVYDKEMDKVRIWLKDNQQEVLDSYNKILFQEQWDKYCLGNISKWEMDSLSYYNNKHELANINKFKYGISDFSKLPEEPEIDRLFTKNGRDIPIYKLTKIVGTCIDKNPTKGSFTLLTPDGEIVDIKLNNEHFAIYNKQISEINEKGEKKVKEKGWFTRGNKLMIMGFRRGNNFVPKKYKNSIGHRLALINEIKDNGEIVYKTVRYGQEDNYE